MKFTCTTCGTEHDINIGALIGVAKSARKARAARRNAKLGGRPKGSKNKPKRPQDVNALAHSVVSDA